MGPGAAEYLATSEGLEEHMATNYLGPFLLTMRMLPHLQAAGTVRTVSPHHSITASINSHLEMPHIPASSAAAMVLLAVTG